MSIYYGKTKVSGGIVSQLSGNIIIVEQLPEQLQENTIYGILSTDESVDYSIIEKLVVKK